MIPQIAHFYWGHTPLSYLHYLTIASFHHWNPDWEITIWHPGDRECPPPPWGGEEQRVQYKGKDWREETFNLPYVARREVPFDQWKIPADVHDVYRSDFLRWSVLCEIGGLWSDFDILYTKPVDALGVNPDTTPATYTWDGGAYIIGFFLACPNLNFFHALSQYSRQLFNPGVYQSIGSDLIFKLYKSPPLRGLLELPMESVYPFQWYPADLLRLFTSEEPFEQGKSTIGVHWYNGSAIARDYCNDIVARSTDDSIMSRLIRATEDALSS